MHGPETESWHLDKRVPIALIFAIAVQTGGALWWAAQIQSRVSGAENNINKLEIIVEMQRDVSNVQAVQLGRIEEQIVGMRSDLSRLVRALERMER